MKCPHCGMNIRDNIVECGYCGGTIARRQEKPASGAEKRAAPAAGAAQKASSRSSKSSDEPEMEGEDEEGGGLSAILQSGEQVLIGSLNVSVKKFFFHAYLTNKRIFLIDTQEKKLKVTAKDVARDTIAGSIVESSESSDPVLVLSIKSAADDDVKTMKLVFVQNGMDRSAEIDEWISLLHEEDSRKSPKKTPARKRVPEPEEPEEPADEEEAEEEEPPARPILKPRQKQELHPARKPLKDPEKQPPVKRLLSLYNVPEPEPEQGEPEYEPEQEPEFEPEPEVVAPIRRTQIRKVPEPARRQVVSSAYDDESSPDRETTAHPVRRPEVQSAMKVAMKGAIRQPLAQPISQPVRRTVVESPRAPLPEPEPEAALVPSRRPVVQESFQEKAAHDEQPSGDNTPQFCHNCGKKLPHSANFCPGCGTKLNQGRTLPHSRTNPSLLNRKATRTDPPGHERRPAIGTVDEDEIEDEKPIPTRPPVKKAPKGSEMTILHKFLRR